MIVVGGEALVDLVPGESTVDAGLAEGLRPLLPRLGGGPYNVALTAARLDAPTAFLSRLSTDRFGEALRARLRESGVRTGMLQEAGEPTTLAVVALDPEGGARYSFYTEGTADRLFTDPGPLPSEVSAFSVGTIGMVLEPAASAYETVLRRESGRGVLTALDPNIRADLIADPAAYRARFARWLPHIRMLKLSVEDAEWLAEGRDPWRGPISAWLAAGVDAVVLTSGTDGLSVFTAAGQLASVPSTPTQLVDTIGAGDTVHGALLAWLHRHEVRELGALGPGEWSAALEFAARTAAITVSRHGAEPPWVAELEGHQPQAPS